VLRGYALDAVDAAPWGVTADRAERPEERHRAEQFLKAMAGAERAMFPAVGLGESWRFMGPDVSGGALTVAGRVVAIQTSSRQLE
jgi:hypothetical protein